MQRGDNHMNNNQYLKKPIAMRFDATLLEQIDIARSTINLPSRTAFVETACRIYALYVCEEH